MWKTRKSSLHCFNFTGRVFFLREAKFPGIGNFMAKRHYHGAFKWLKNKQEDISLPPPPLNLFWKAAIKYGCAFSGVRDEFS